MTIMDVIKIMDTDVLDAIIFSAFIDDLINKIADKETRPDNQKETKPENPVEVCIYHGSMIVTFNDVDRHQIQEFIIVLHANQCKYTQEENEFEIRADGKTLYMILLYLTDEYEEIALY